MKLHFSIEYLTHWGEDVRVSLTLVDAKGRTQTQTYPMETRDGHRWTGEVLITDGRIRSFHYHYSVYKEGRKFRTEWDFVPRRFRADITKTYLFRDAWQDVPLLSHLYTSAFTQCVLLSLRKGRRWLSLVTNRRWESGIRALRSA